MGPARMIWGRSRIVTIRRIRTIRVPLTTDLGFDETMVYCKVTTNFEPFIFPAFNPAFGMVPLDAHSFFMDMQSTRIDRLDIVDGPDGQPRAIYEGVMRSITRVNVAELAANSIEEEIPYGCVADDDPFGTPAEVGISKNSFSMTGYFDPGGGHHLPVWAGIHVCGHLDERQHRHPERSGCPDTRADVNQHH